MLPIHTPQSLNTPDDYFPEISSQDHQSLGRKNIYLARTGKLELSFKEEQLLRTTLDNLAKDRDGKNKPFNRLSDDWCRDLLEILHAQVSEECRIKLNQAEFETVSSLSIYSNSRAKDKLCALKEFLDDSTTTIKFVQFSTRELKAICAALNDIHATEIRINLDHDLLIIKQNFLYDAPQVSIQHDECRPCTSNCSLEEFKAELINELNARAEKKYWVNSPIRKLNYDEIKPIIQIFKNNMKDWNTFSGQKRDELQVNLDYRDVSLPRSPMRKRWNKKINNTQYILHIIPQNKSKEYYVYEINKTPVGIMVLDNAYPDEIVVDWIVAHPGSEGGGSSLMEVAVMRSVESEKKGWLRLRPLDYDAEQAYLAMGFEMSGEYMVLRPETSDKWIQKETGKWKLKNYMDKRYLRTAFDSDIPY